MLGVWSVSHRWPDFRTHRSDGERSLSSFHTFYNENGQTYKHHHQYVAPPIPPIPSFWEQMSPLNLGPHVWWWWWGERVIEQSKVGIFLALSPCQFTNPTRLIDVFSTLTKHYPRLAIYPLLPTAVRKTFSFWVAPLL